MNIFNGDCWLFSIFENLVLIWEQCWRHPFLEMLVCIHIRIIEEQLKKKQQPKPSHLWYGTWQVL